MGAKKLKPSVGVFSWTGSSECSFLTNSCWVSSKGTFTLLNTFAYKVKGEKTCFTLIVSSFIVRVNADPGGSSAPPFMELHNTVALSKGSL